MHPEQAFLNPIFSGTVFSQSPTCVSAPLGDEIALLDSQAGIYFTLNEVGGVIWNHLTEPRNLESICDLLTSTYNVEKAQCQPDIEELLQQMIARGLVIVA